MTHMSSERASERILVLAIYTPHRRRFFLVLGQGAERMGEGFLAFSSSFLAIGEGINMGEERENERSLARIVR